MANERTSAHRPEPAMRRAARIDIVARGNGTVSCVVHDCGTLDTGRMKEPPLSVLVVEDPSHDSRKVCDLLEASVLAPNVHRARNLAEAVWLLRERTFDAVLLDLFLVDSEGLDTLRALSTHAAGAPVVILTSRRHQTIALQAVRAGAQDFLAREGMKGEMLVRALTYAIERHRLLEEVRSASLRDELTGLYNRRGFATLAEQQMRMALRNSAPMTLLFADLDEMKLINDRFGHQAGDEVLRSMTAVLRRTFRNCDILGRIGGDEFVALALDADHSGAQVILDRLVGNIADENEASGRPYSLAASTGIVVFDPHEPVHLDELLGRADAAMYANKRRRVEARGR